LQRAPLFLAWRQSRPWPGRISIVRRSVRRWLKRAANRPLLFCSSSREATAAARALVKWQADRIRAELEEEAARVKAEDEALASTQREWEG
jgi:hypothetical protein